MYYFLVYAYRRRWLSYFEVKRYLRVVRNALAARPLSVDWSTPHWVRGSLRRSAYWAVCHVAMEQPHVLIAGVVCAVPAATIVVVKGVGALMHWVGRLLGGGV